MSKNCIISGNKFSEKYGFYILKYKFEIEIYYKFIEKGSRKQ